MEVDLLVRECLEMNQQLEQFQLVVSQKGNLMKNEVIQTFIFDLRDYVNAVKLLEDITSVHDYTDIDPQNIEATDVSVILGEHAHRFPEIRKLLAEHEDLSGTVRRQISGLDSVIELNKLMLLDNRQFQQEMKVQSISVVPTSNETEDKTGGFFHRLFSKK